MFIIQNGARKPNIIELLMNIAVRKPRFCVISRGLSV